MDEPDLLADLTQHAGEGRYSAGKIVEFAGVGRIHARLAPDEEDKPVGQEDTGVAPSPYHEIMSRGPLAGCGVVYFAGATHFPDDISGGGKDSPVG